MLIRSLERSDIREGFSCGVPSLDRFLERYAWQIQARYRLGITYVATDDATRRVLGYFTLAELERVGCAGVVVDALPETVGFYERFGFRPMEVLVGAGAVRPRPTPMWLGIGTIRRAGE